MTVEVYGSTRKPEQHQSSGGRYNAMDETVGDENMNMTIASLNKTGPIGTLGMNRRFQSDLKKSDPYPTTTTKDDYGEEEQLDDLDALMIQKFKNKNVKQSDLSQVSSYGHVNFKTLAVPQNKQNVRGSTNDMIMMDNTIGFEFEPHSLGA